VEKSNLRADDLGLIVLLATSSASLDESPKKNWVENAGNLPPYVRKLARAIMKTGKSKSQAIAIAISRIKKWAAGGDEVNADTRAKAAKALAQWEALKAKNKAKQVVKATGPNGVDYVFLAGDDTDSYNVEQVRDAWRAAVGPKYDRGISEVSEPYPWVKEVWNDFIIVEQGTQLYKVGFEYTQGRYEFDRPVPVEVTYRAIGGYDNEDDAYGDLDDNEDDAYGDLDDDEVSLLAIGMTRLDTEHREKLADKGKALPDGSYPIANVGDLKNAIQAIGRAKDPAKAKRHIKKRARELGHPELIPEGW
jgi:hypothetical protein